MPLLLSFAMLLLATHPYAQIPGDLQSAIDARLRAVEAGDEQTWGRYTADSFIFIRSDGAVRNKTQRMSEIKGRKITRPPSVVEQHYSVHGDTVLDVRLYRYDTGRVTRTLEVWIKSREQWQVVSVQQTLASSTR